MIDDYLQKLKKGMTDFGIAKSTFVIICIVLSLFTRFYNLEKTGTFFWDPALDLMKIQEYFEQKTITMVGPISEDGNKVYSAVTYYMLMPFAVMGNFDIASTTYAAALYGFVTVLLLLFLTYKVNKHMLPLIALLNVVWFPLLETSRWAWNPNLMLVWISLSLLLFQYKKSVTIFASGVSLALAVHNHYLAAVAGVLFIIFSALWLFKEEKVKLSISMIVGFICGLLPFVIFDVLRPPGLFLTRFLYFNQTAVEPSSLDFFSRVWNNFSIVFNHYTHSTFFSILLAILLIIVVVYDWKQVKKNLLFLVIWFIQIVAIAFINASYSHYFLPGLLFFVFYLLIPRKGMSQTVAQLIVSVLILASFLTVIPQLTTQKYIDKAWQPNIETTERITETMANAIQERQLERYNVAVLHSQDSNTYGWKYRSLLALKKIYPMSKFEYFVNDYLFVVSQDTAENLRQAEAPEMYNFKDKSLLDTWSMPESDWKVYLFTRKEN